MLRVFAFRLAYGATGVSPGQKTQPPLRFGHAVVDTFSCQQTPVAQLLAELETCPEAVQDTLAKLVWRQGASDTFMLKGLQLLAEKLSPRLLEDLQSTGYSLIFKDLLTTDFPTGNPYTGGTHDPEEQKIMVSEYVLDQKTNNRILARGWQNGLIHEIGHKLVHHLGRRQAKKLLPQDGLSFQAVADLLREKGVLNKHGITESSEFQKAYMDDFSSMPEIVREESLNYFTYPRWKDDTGKKPEGIVRPRARQEAFAESFDILMRGGDSKHNYALFTQHFKRVLKAVAELLRKEYPDIQFHPDLAPILQA